MQTQTETTTQNAGTPGTDTQKLRLLLEEKLVASARYASNPTPAHAAERDRTEAWFQEAGGWDATPAEAVAKAQEIATERYDVDVRLARCLCWRCGQAQATKAVA